MNKNKTIITAVFIFALIFASLAFADSITSVTTSSSVSTATTGTNVAITSVSSADSGTVTATRIEIVSSGSGTGGSLTISDPSAGYYSSVPVSSSGTSKTFTVTAGTADTYTYSVRATYSGGSKSSTDAILEFVNPSALTVSGSPSTTTKALSESFTLSISIQNSQSSAITSSYSLSYDSTYFTVTGDPTSSSSTTINAGTTTTLQWTVTEAAAYSGSKTITFALGDNLNAFTTTVTNDPTCSDSVQNGNETGTDCGGSCDACSTGDSSSGGGGGGGGAGGVSEAVTYTLNKASISYSSISENSTKIIRFSNVTATDVKNITFKAANRISNMELSIHKITSKPSGVTTPSGNVYRYIQIDEVNVTDDNVTDVKINFFVEKSWYTNNNLDYTTTVLNRFKNNAWTALTTTKSWEDATYYYFEADSPGLSVFVITAETAAAEEPTAPAVPTGPVCGDNVIEGNEECETIDDITDTCESRGFTGGTLRCTNCRIDESQCTMETIFGETTKEAVDYTIYMIIAILIVIIIAGYFYYHGHRHF